MIMNNFNFSLVKLLSVFTVVTLLTFINYKAFGQLSTQQANEIRETIGSNMIKLLLDTNNNSRSTKIFLIKLQVDDGSVLKPIELSDNLDSIFKQSYLANINTLVLRKKIKGLGLKNQTIIIPVHYIYGKNDLLKGVSVSKNSIASSMLFNKVAIEGDCYWLQPIVTTRR
jgi:hypothetical protein